MTRISLRTAAHRFLQLLAGTSILLGSSLAMGQPTAPASGDLPQQIRQAKDDFRPVTPQDAAKAKERLTNALANLESLLRNGPQENLEAWKQYLRWEELQSELESDEPALRRLEEIYLRFRGSHAGLDRRQTIHARQALRHYINMAYFAGIDQHQQQFEAQLDTLADSVERYLQEPTTEDAQVIGGILGWLEQGDQVPWLVGDVRQRLDRPNLYASVSDRFISRGIRRGVNQINPVHECILGTDVRGTAHLVGDVDVDLIPSRDKGLIQLTLNGNLTSDNVGVNGPATIYSTGFSSVNARKLLVVDREGVSGMPASADAFTSTVFNAICANLRLVQRIATKRAYQQKSQAEAIASQRAATRIEQRFDAESVDLIADANRRLDTELRRHLRGRDEEPQAVQFSSTNTHLNVELLQVSPAQVAAPDNPPQASEPGADLVVRMHESLLNNYGEAFLGGIELTDERLVEILEEREADIPEELQITPDKDPWSITFDYQRPIEVNFNPDSVTIGIRGRQFTRGDSVVNRTIQISANYQIEQGEAGARLIRQGEVEVDFPTQQRLGALDLTAKTFLRRKFEAVFQEEIIGEGIELEGEWRKAGTLRLSSLQVSPGWFVGSWRLDAAAPPATAVTSVEKVEK